MKLTECFVLLNDNVFNITQLAFFLLSHSFWDRYGGQMTLPQPTLPKGNEAMTSLSLSSCKFLESLGRFIFSGGYEFSFLLKLIQTK